MAPEVFKKQRYRGDQADVWSLGICLYIMLCGTIPFASKNMKELGEIVSSGKLDFPLLQGQASDASPDKVGSNQAGSKISKDAQSLISWMLSVDPSKRPSLKQVLNHKWVLNFKAGNFNNRNKVYTRAERAHMKYMIQVPSGSDEV